MFKGQIEKGPKGRLHLLIKATGNGLAGNGPGAAVGGEGVGRLAIDIAGDLVEQKNEAQRTDSALGFPIIVLAACGSHMHRFEPQAQGLVKPVVLGEPFAGSRILPIDHHVMWRR